jgi:hypothetical protein
VNPPVIHLASVTRPELPFGAPRVISSDLENGTAAEPLPGGGSASVDVGATPAALPGSGWAVVPGSSSGFSGGRVKAVFSGGGGSGAAGYFTISAGGVLSSLTITAGGSGYTGTVTAAPYRQTGRSVFIDLGDDWHQYTRASIHLTGITGDSCLRATAEMGPELGALRAIPLAFQRSASGVSEMWLQPWSGGSPAALIVLGSRYYRFKLDIGMDTGPNSCLTVCAMPQ